MKKVTDILNLDIVSGLPSSDNIRGAMTRVSVLQEIPTTRDLHAANIGYDELEALLTNIGAMSYTGSMKSTYVMKLKKLKPTTNVPIIDFI